ncbi:MAG: DNA recombination protein RmuC [Prevotella sp.]|jgi:DNA recombination protein RmuC|nr:DNA recombination protein RmuC [Prevotella sp.]
MIITYILIALIIGGGIGYLAAQSKLAKLKLEAQNELATANANAQTTLANEQARAQQELNDCRLEAQRQLAAVQTELETVRTQLKAEQERNSQETLLREEKNRKEAEIRQEQFAAQLKTVQEQFSNLATKVLDQTSDKLKTQNNESMEHITKPLRDNLEQLQKAIQNTNTETTKSTSSLTQQLKEMAERTDKINLTAQELTNVIKGSNKIQGNWGERILTEILASQGLQEGIDYDVQQIITDEKGNIIENEDSGRRMIPDVILHYPNDEDVVIDSKMSIDAYYNYVNTEDEMLKRKYAADMVKSIRTQVNGLAKKEYSKYIKAPRKAIDFVIMFVPNEGALQLALATEPRLWGEAFEKQVFITSQQNLMAILKMIQVAWRQYAQTENQNKVYGLAEELLKRVGEFIKRFDKVGSDIESLHKHYEEAYKKAYTGKQSIIQKANELKELGVKENANHSIRSTEPDLLEE